ncbi:DUF115 domain-containing protein [bacterium]|nr:DUF115 domain-containing protein [bacterium]
MNIHPKNRTELERHPSLLALANAEGPFGPLDSTQPPSPGSLFPLDNRSNITDRYEQCNIGPVKNDSVHVGVVFGVGCGQAINVFYQTHIKTLVRLIVVEPEPAVFRHVLAEEDVSCLLKDERVLWCVGKAMREIQIWLDEACVNIGAQGLVCYVNEAEKACFPAAFGCVLTMMQNAVEHAEQNKQVQTVRGLFIQHNLLRNLPFFLRSIPLRAFENRFCSIPALVIGAGPSLDKQLEILKTVPSTFLIVAVDTAIHVLQSNGIQPHFIVAADPMQMNFKHFQRVESLEPAVLAFLPETNYKILEKYPNHSKMVCLHDLESKTIRAWASFLNIKTTFRRGMNVGYCAFSLARQLGCSPLILVGMDLAISTDGATHAKHTANVSQVHYSTETQTAEITGNVPEKERAVVEVEGYYGQPVLTYPSFRQYILHFEKEMAQMDTPVIDATEGGAKKQGAIQSSLQEVLQTRIESRDIGAILNEVRKERPTIHLSALAKALQYEAGELQKAFQDLKQNRARLDQWFQKALREQWERETMEKQIDVFFEHWKHFLYSEPLDTAIDIGLAKWRYALLENTPPQNVSSHEWLDWWHARFKEWMEGVEKDLEIFIPLYAYLCRHMTSAGK